MPTWTKQPLVTLAAQNAQRFPRSGHTPAVVFVDEGLMTPFVQLAVMLRRAGYRTVRVTTSNSPENSFLLRLIAFDRVIHVNSSEFDRLDHVLATERIIDVQCAARLAIATYRALERLPTGHRANGWRSRADLIDKRVVARLLDEASIAHPPSLAGETAPVDAVKALGLPIVLKPRVGSGGIGVSIAQTLAELEELYRGIGDSSSVFFEGFVAGSPVNYGAVVGPDGAERDMTYRTVRRGLRARSPSIEITCEQDETFTAIGRHLAQALSCEGLLNVDAIRDCSGRYWVHDVNLPVWGAFFASRDAGFDLTAAYLRWLSDQTNHSAGNTDRIVRIFPNYLGTVLRSKKPSAVLRSIRSDLREYRRLLGWGYVLYELRRSTRILLRRRRRGPPTALPVSKASPSSERDTSPTLTDKSDVVDVTDRRSRFDRPT